jgi:hypothetical protein
MIEKSDKKLISRVIIVLGLDTVGSRLPNSFEYFIAQPISTSKNSKKVIFGKQQTLSQIELKSCCKVVKTTSMSKLYASIESNTYGFSTDNNRINSLVVSFLCPMIFKSLSMLIKDRAVIVESNGCTLGTHYLNYVQYALDHLVLIHV